MIAQLEHLIDFKALRARSGLTQVQVSQRLGVPQTTVSSWEQGRQPAAKHLPAMAEMFGCTIAELYGLPKE